MDKEIERRDAMFKIIGELDAFVDLNGSDEWSDTARAMIALWYQRTLLSDKFVKQIETEIKAWLKDVKANTEIVEETITPEPYTIKSLEWY